MNKKQIDAIRKRKADREKIRKGAEFLRLLYTPPKDDKPETEKEKPCEN